MLKLKETVLLGARAEQSNTLGDFPELPVAADSTAGLALKGSSARLSMRISVISCVLMMVEFRIHSIWILASPGSWV